MGQRQGRGGEGGGGKVWEEEEDDGVNKQTKHFLMHKYLAIAYNFVFDSN